ncbi:MAG TPA: phospholipase D-like domain-containing protein [Candidatus Saccharimonadales bacterium]|jgi:phosphatidylserine/phosphatidylglycerophosphate/cardiolipin synthase-like enzyme|nr:phospholipase D-like domain-containing protein [Candidatus Saccharimonadales bacterium]
MLKLRKTQRSNYDDLVASKLYDQDDFYKAFLDDLKKVKREVIIESPFITMKRMNSLLPVFRQLVKHGKHIVINTKPLDELEPYYQAQSAHAIVELQELGIQVLLTRGHHRKLAVIDKQITWEGSLNILSQNDSCEVMRRLHSEQLAGQMLAFLHLEKFIT